MSAVLVKFVPIQPTPSTLWLSVSLILYGSGSASEWWSKTPHLSDAKWYGFTKTGGLIDIWSGYAWRPEKAYGVAFGSVYIKLAQVRLVTLDFRLFIFPTIRRGGGSLRSQELATSLD